MCNGTGLHEGGACCGTSTNHYRAYTLLNKVLPPLEARISNGPIAFLNILRSYRGPMTLGGFSISARMVCTSIAHNVSSGGKTHLDSVNVTT